MWFTPSVGATSIELRLYSTIYNQHSFDLCTQLQIFSTAQNYALSYRTFLPKPSAHSSTEVIHALSWDLTLNPKIDLGFFASHHHNTKLYLTPLHKCLFIQVHYYNTMGLKTMGPNHGYPQTMGHLQKEGLRPNPETPKTILDHNSAYKLHTKTTEFPKLRTFKVHTPKVP